MRDLSEFLSAGLAVEDLRAERAKVVFYDIGAVVYLLRVVVWTVPDFSVERYRSRLRQLHDHIARTGAFETTSSRFLIEASRPAWTAPEAPMADAHGVVRDAITGT